MDIYGKGPGAWKYSFYFGHGKVNDLWVYFWKMRVIKCIAINLRQ